MSRPETHSQPSSRLRIWLRRIGLTLFALFALTFVFYTIENVRGRNAWHNAIAELEAKGEKILWEDFIPAPIPDDQNILKAPMMEEWFVKGNTPRWDDHEALAQEAERLYGPGPFVVAKMVFVTGPTKDSENANAPLIEWKTIPRNDDREIYESPLNDVMTDLFGLILTKEPPTHPSPRAFYFRSDEPPDSESIGHELMREGIECNLSTKATAEPGSFLVLATNSPSDATVVLSAKDYLAMTEPFLADFEKIRQALGRPKAVMPSDPTSPFSDVGQKSRPALALGKVAYQRASVYLLLGNADEALKSLEMVEAGRSLLATAPSLVIQGFTSQALLRFKTTIVCRGLARGLWNEKQLRSLQGQYASERLLEQGVKQLRTERAGACREAEMISLEKIMEAKEMFATFTGEKPSPWWRDPQLVLFQASPKGWSHQNMADFALAFQALIEGIDAEKRVLDAGAGARAATLATKHKKGLSAYSLIAEGIHGMVGFYKTLPLSQTQADLTVILLGLERHRLATGTLPASLDLLVPKYCDRLPHQVVNGKQFHYRLDPDGGASVWSEGWNLTAEGYLKGHPHQPGKEDDDWGMRLPARPRR